MTAFNPFCQHSSVKGIAWMVLKLHQNIYHACVKNPIYIGTLPKVLSASWDLISACQHSSIKGIVWMVIKLHQNVYHGHGKNPISYWHAAKMLGGSWDFENFSLLAFQHQEDCSDVHQTSPECLLWMWEELLFHIGTLPKILAVSWDFSLLALQFQGD